MLNEILNFAKRTAARVTPEPGAGVVTTDVPKDANFLPIDAVSKYVFSKNPNLRKDIRPHLETYEDLRAQHSKHADAKLANSYFPIANRRKAALREMIAGNAPLAPMVSLEEELLVAAERKRLERQRMRQVADEARPVAGEICRLYAAAATIAADALEAEEKSRAELLGVAFEPSLALKTVRQAAWRAAERIGIPGTSAFPGLPFQLDLI